MSTPQMRLQAAMTRRVAPERTNHEKDSSWDVPPFYEQSLLGIRVPPIFNP